MRFLVGNYTIIVGGMRSETSEQHSWNKSKEIVVVMVNEPIFKALQGNFGLEQFWESWLYRVIASYTTGIPCTESRTIITLFEERRPIF